MPLNDNGKNAMLEGGLGNAAAYASLHTGDPSTTGANELTGGSPAYARKAITWNTASGGTRTNNGAITFDVGAGNTIYHIGLFSAVTSGTFYGYFPIGGYAPRAGSVEDTADTILSYAHGLSADQRVLIFDVQGAGVLGGTEGTVYYVLSSGLTTDVFKVSTSSGGAALNFSADGEIFWMRVAPETFGNQGQFQIGSGSLTLDARLA